MPTHITEMMEARNDIRDRQMHQQLKNDLVQNIWHKYGSSQDNN